MTRGQRLAAERDQDDVGHLQDALEADQEDYAASVAGQRVAIETRAMLLEKLRSSDGSSLTLTLGQTEIGVLIEALVDEREEDQGQTIDISEA